MSTLRRIFTAAALVVAATGFASANIITTVTFGGCTAVSGGTECTVTQSGSIGIPTAVNMNIVSPTSLFNFQNYGNLGIGGGAVLNGATFDYQYDNFATNLSITNNDTVNSASVNVALQSTALLDSGTNMPGCVAGVASGNNDCLHARNGMVGIGNAGAAGTANNIFSMSNLTLGPGATQTFAPPPISFTNGISYSFCAPTSCFGNPADELALNFNNYTGSGFFSFGLTDAASFSQGAAGNGGSANITVVYTTTYDAQASLTYDYFISNGTPEPSTMLLMGSALVGLSFAGRRLTKKR